MAKALSLAIALAVVAAVSTVHASPSGPSWPQFHFDAAHTGYNPSEGALRVRTVKRLRQAWSAQAAGAFKSSAAIAEGLAFAASDDGTVHAYRTSDGSPAWSAAVVNGSAFMASTALASGDLFVFSSRSRLEAFAAGTGRRLWAKSIGSVEGGFPSSPTVAGDVVYAVTDDLVASDIRTGNTLWTRVGLNCSQCSPAVSGGTLYVWGGPSAGRQLLALDATTGERRWAVKPTVVGDFDWNGSPAVAGKTLYIIGWASRTRPANRKAYSLYAFDGSTGKRRWKVRVGSSRFFTGSSPAVANGVVFYASPSGRLYAIRTSGKRLWSRKITPTDSSPAIAHGVVYLGSGHAVYAFAARTGKRLWHAKTADDVDASPIVVGGSLYVGSSDGRLHAYRLRGA